MAMAYESAGQTPRAIFERLHRAVRDDYDMDTQADLYAPDGVLEMPFAPAGTPRRIEGREAIRQVLKMAGNRARRDGRRIVAYRNVVVRATDDPEVIVAEFDLHGESTATGATYTLPFIQVLRVRDGQIVAMRDYFDSQALAGSLSPAPGN
jgi:ketosteroid isomerase-like protein